MQFSSAISLASFFATSAFAHSWLECVDTSFKDGSLEAYEADPESFGLYTDQWTKLSCNGYPRNREDHPEGNDQGAVGQWGWDSSNYAYDFDEGDPVQACSTFQSTATYPDGKPMTTATPGQELLMWFWGNGHTSWGIGSPNHRDPGLVRVYWAGEPDTQLQYASDLTEKNWIPGAQKNFSQDAITVYDQGATSVGGMHELANFMKFTLPSDMAEGTYHMVWEWAWKEASVASGAVSFDENTYDSDWTKAWGTCFDVTIGQGSSGSSSKTSSSKTASKTASSTAGASVGTQSMETDAAVVDQSGSSSGICSSSCNAAGDAASVLTASQAKTQAPCYIPNADGSYDCYYYGDDGVSCPWSGMTDCASSSSKRDVHSRRSHMRKHKRWSN